jgi:hypothetical protein
MHLRPEYLQLLMGLNLCKGHSTSKLLNGGTCRQSSGEPDSHVFMSEDKTFL